MSTLLEIVIPTEHVAGFGIADRDAIESALDEALAAGALGEVTGAGMSETTANLDVEVDDESNLAAALAAVQAVLWQRSLPASTMIHVRGEGPARAVRLGIHGGKRKS